MTGRLYPRLSRELARSRITALRGVAPEELLAAAELLLEGHTFAPIGGSQVSEEELSRLLIDAVRLARDCGFPEARRETSRLRFDRQMARLLHERMEITPHQAADEEIWAHLTCGPFIALAAWRFPGLPDERALGRAPRNTFRRLWWRAEILGSTAWEEEGGLLEDETVQIMERTGIAASPLVARALAGAFIRRVRASPDLRRMDLMRDAMKRVNRLTPFVVLEALPAVPLSGRLDRVFAESAAAIGDGEPAEIIATISATEEPDYLADALIDVGAPGPGTEISGSADVPDRREDPRPAGSLDTPPTSGKDTDASTDPEGDLEHTQLGRLMEILVSAVASRGVVPDAELARVVTADSGLEVSRSGARMIRKLAWSAKGRRQLSYDEVSEEWSAGEAPAAFDERFGEWTFAAIVGKAAEMLAVEADPFDHLVELVGGQGRAPRVVASIVGTAINTARRAGVPGR